MKLSDQFRIPEFNEVHTINSLVVQVPQMITVNGKKIRLTIPGMEGFYEWSVSKYAAESVVNKLHNAGEMCVESASVRGVKGTCS